MVRDIAWKDLFSISKYRSQLSYLDNDLRLIYDPGLVSSGLLSIAGHASGFYTAIDSNSNDGYPFIIGQLFLPAHSTSARLVFLAPKEMGAQMAPIH